MLFINNKFTTSEPYISVQDRGLLLGDGFFETIRAQQGEPLFLDLHWERLLKSAQLLEIPIAYSLEKITQIIKELLIHNHLTTDIARIRITITRGCSENGIAFSKPLQPTVIINATPYTTPVHDIKKIIISSIHRNELSPLSTIKSINYLDNILAFQEAKHKKAEDALLLNTRHNLACATTANVFIVKNNIIYTPSVKDGALPGIMREIVFGLAKSLNIAIKEKSIAAEELKTADEIFLTNSLIGVRPILYFYEKSLDKTLAQTLQEALREFGFHYNSP